MENYNHQLRIDLKNQYIVNSDNENYIGFNIQFTYN